MKRRIFMAQTAALAAAPLIAAETAAGLIDCNVHLGSHPLRVLPEISESFLAKREISEAWAGSHEALLHRDMAAVNDRLVKRCAVSPRLRAVGSVNPRLPAWKDDLKRCVELYGMKVIRLYPNHHDYTLTDAAFLKLLESATKQNLLLQLVAQMEDQRTQSPLMKLIPVDLKPLRALMKTLPEARVMVLNANAAMITTELLGCTNLWLDIAMIEGVGGVENTLKGWPVDKLCFGSHAPFFYWESASLKMQESVLTDEQTLAIRHQNARALL